MSNEEIVKAAVGRMCAYFSERNIKVKRTMMYEAVADGFGLDSWRELKAVIDAPRAEPAVKVPALGEWQQWRVDAIYTDNDQQYGDSFSGRTPLEAAINAQIERLTDFGNEINIVSVSDEAGKCRLSPSYITEIELCANDAALKALARALTSLGGTVLVDPQLRRSVEWLYDDVLDGDLEDPDVGKFDHVPDTLAYLTDYDLLDETEAGVSDAETNPDAPTVRLNALCELLESAHGGIVALESKNEELATKVFQIRAMCGYFGAIFNHPTKGLWPQAEAGVA